MRILNFGSLNYDRVYEVESFVQAGQTISSLKYSEFMGGKGLNQSVALSKACCEVYHIGVVGPDGADLIELLRTEGVKTKFIFETEIHSGHAVIQINRSGENAIIVDGGANLELSKEHVNYVFAHFQEEPCIVLAQNEISNLDYIMRQAKQNGHTLFLNPSPMNESLLQAPLELVDYFILNETEAYALTLLEDPADSIKKIKELYPQCKVILTLGEQGSLYFDEERLLTQPAYRTIAIDTTCAGDTFTGYVIGGITSGEPLEEILRRASIASSLCIEIKGAANSIPTFDKVMEKENSLHEKNTNTAY